MIEICGTGSYLPERIVDNFELAESLDTSDEWIYSKVGIKERRVAAKEQTTSDLAAEAGKRALADAGVKPLELDLIIVATSSPDMIQPSTACLVQHKLGAVNAGAFDVVAVCAGFLYAFSVATDMMKGNPHYRQVLVIGAETYSKILDWTDRTTAVFFGDGAGAVVLRKNEESKSGVLSTYVGANGEGWDVITFPAGGTRYPATEETVRNRMHYFRMEGRRVWDFATAILPKALEVASQRAGISVHDLDFVIVHQANINIIKTALAKLGFPMEKTHTTIKKYGNTSGASVPITLDEAIRLGKIKRGDLVGLAGFGGGLTWGSAVIRY